MIDGHERGSLPTTQHVIRPQVIDHVDAGLAGQQSSITQLDRERFIRPVQNRLPMKSGNINIARLKPV